MKQEFYFSPKYYIKFAPRYILLLVGTITFSLHTSSSEYFITSYNAALIFIVPFYLFFLYMLVVRGNSYRLIIDDDSITRIMKGTQDITLEMNEITKIVDYKNQNLAIFSATPNVPFIIPNYVESFDDIKTCLSEWSTPEIVIKHNIYNRGFTKFRW